MTEAWLAVLRLLLLFLVVLSLLVLAEGFAEGSLCPLRRTFSDEFNKSQLDTAKWNVVYPSGRTELQYYANDTFEIKNGVLRIKADRRTMEGYDYTSGIITTLYKFSQTYGVFEIRAKVPAGQGLWPAFWLMPADRKIWPPEIDVFEILGHEPDKVYMSNHWRNAAGQHVYLTQSYRGPDFSKDFHTFRVEWGPSTITWYIDGVKRATTNQNVPSLPMFVLTNLAVGGEWPGNPDGTTSFPSYLEIDYIRVSQRSCVVHLPVVVRR